jgi:hypothetical protein
MLARSQAVLHTVAALRPREILLLAWSVGLLAALPVLLRVLPLPTLVILYGARPLSAVLPPLAPDRLLWLIRGLLHQRIGMVRPNCLKQSLVLFHFLRQWDAPVALFLGVATHGGTLTGHCWVELDGQPLGEGDDPQRVFTIVYTFPEDNVNRRRSAG